MLWRRGGQSIDRTGTSGGLPHLNCKVENTGPNPSQGTVRIKCNKGSVIDIYTKNSNIPATWKNSEAIKGSTWFQPLPPREGLQRAEKLPCQTQINLHFLGTHFKFHISNTQVCPTWTNNISLEVHVDMCGWFIYASHRAKQRILKTIILSCFFQMWEAKGNKKMVVSKYWDELDPSEWTDNWGGPRPFQTHPQSHRPGFNNQKTGLDALTSKKWFAAEYYLSFKKLEAQCDKTKPPRANYQNWGSYHRQNRHRKQKLEVRMGKGNKGSINQSHSQGRKKEGACWLDSHWQLHGARRKMALSLSTQLVCGPWGRTSDLGPASGNFRAKTQTPGTDSLSRVRLYTLFTRGVTLGNFRAFCCLPANWEWYLNHKAAVRIKIS